MRLCRTSWKSKGKKKKKDDKSQKLDLYALLGLQNERWTATEAQIKLGERHDNAEAGTLQSCMSSARTPLGVVLS